MWTSKGREWDCPYMGTQVVVYISHSIEQCTTYKLYFTLEIELYWVCFTLYFIVKSPESNRTSNATVK